MGHVVEAEQAVASSKTEEAIAGCGELHVEIGLKDLCGECAQRGRRSRQRAKQRRAGEPAEASRPIPAAGSCGAGESTADEVAAASELGAEAVQFVWHGPSQLRDIAKRTSEGLASQDEEEQLVASLIRRLAVLRAACG